MHILAGHDEHLPGSAATEITIPLPGAVPHEKGIEVMKKPMRRISR